MREKFVDKLSNWTLIFFVTFASWCGAESFGDRAPVQISNKFKILSGLTVPGLVNFIGIGTVFLILLLKLWPRWKERRFASVELLIFSYAIFCILNFRIIDKEYLILVENTLFLSIICLGILNKDLFLGKLKAFCFWGPILQGISFFLAMLIPALVPITVPIKMYEGIPRFTGWLGLATYIGFLGLSTALSNTIALRNNLDKKWIRAVNLALVFCGIGGIVFAVHRIVLFAALIAFLVLFIGAIRKKEVVFAVATGVFTLVTLLSFFTPNFQKKSDTNIELFEENNSNINYLIQTNGRLDVFLALWAQTKGSRVFGKGTGFAARYMLKIKHVFGNNPHSDYLRVFVDEGCPTEGTA